MPKNFSKIADNFTEKFEELSEETSEEGSEELEDKKIAGYCQDQISFAGCLISNKKDGATIITNSFIPSVPLSPPNC